MVFSVTIESYRNTQQKNAIISNMHVKHFQPVFVIMPIIQQMGKLNPFFVACFSLKIWSIVQVNCYKIFTFHLCNAVTTACTKLSIDKRLKLIGSPFLSYL